MADWYDSVLKTNGPDQIANGTYIFNHGFVADNLETELVQGINWNEFLEEVLIDGKTQIIKGKFKS